MLILNDHEMDDVHNVDASFSLVTYARICSEQLGAPASIIRRGNLDVIYIGPSKVSCSSDFAGFT